jgi:hypothetical protein
MKRRVVIENPNFTEGKTWKMCVDACQPIGHILRGRMGRIHPLKFKLDIACAVARGR